MSRIKVTNLRHESATSDNISLDSSGNVSAPGNLSVTGTTTFTDDLNVDSGSLFVDASADRVGIGTTAPDSPVHIKGTAQMFPRVETTSSTNDAGWKFKNGSGEWSTFVNGTNGAYRIYNETSSIERMRVELAGRTSIFTTDTDSFDIGNSNDTGTTRKTIRAYHSATGVQNGTEMFYVQNNGDVKNTNNSYGSISDQRLKENIVDAGSQWQDIKDLRVRKFNFRENTGHQTHTQIGLIAQEAETVSAGLVADIPVTSGEVVLDADGIQLESTKTVNYSVLYMKSVKALQEAMTRIETLETANANQAATIAAFEARLTALEG